MSYAKRMLENLIYEVSPDKAYDMLIEKGFDEESAQEMVDAYFGDD